ncbi:MAG: hypothetical protein WC511_04160 [Candidatus Pacearchaeota archaeon]
MEKKKNKVNVKKKEVCETFNVEENGQEKIVESCGIEEEKISNEGQIKKQNKLFKSILLVMVGFLAFFFLILFVNYSMNHFKVEGVTFEIDTNAIIGTTLYRTSIPGIIDENGNFTIGNYDKNKASYNVWFRNDPRKLIEEVSFEGNLTLLKNIVLNQEGNFACNGDYIGIQNLLNLYSNTGAKVISDANASCDDLGRYALLEIVEGNETKIMEYDDYGECYKIEVKDCEILPATERFLLELIVKINEELKK